MRHLLPYRSRSGQAFLEHRGLLLRQRSLFQMSRSFLLRELERRLGAEQELLMVPGMLLSHLLRQPLDIGSVMAETGQTLLIGQIRPTAQAASLFRLPMIRLSSTRIQLLREVKLSLLT